MNRVSKGLSILLLLLLLTACSGGQDGARGNAVDSADSVVKRVVQHLEKGDYRKAEELIQSDIMGNLVKEEEAEAYFQRYAEAVVSDYNYGKLSLELARQICRTGQQTAYASSFSSAEFRLDLLHRSKEYYETGKAAFERGDEKEAVSALSMVDTEDGNFDSSVELLYQVAQRNAESDDYHLLHAAYDAITMVQWSRDFTAVDPCSTEELQEQILQIGTRFGRALEEDRQLRYAARIYGQTMALAFQWQRSEMGVYSADFERVMRVANCMEYDPTAGSYHLSIDGSVRADEGAWWKIGSGLLTQVEVSADYQSGTILGTLDPFGQVSLQGGREDDANWQSIESNLNRRKKSTATGIKLYLNLYNYDSMFGALLFSDGTLTVGGDRSRYDLSELVGWQDVIDFYQIGNGFVGLMDNGRLCATGSIASKLGAAMEWNDVKAISFGAVQPQGYQPTSISLRTNSFIYGLTHDGKIRYQQYDASDGKVPVSGVFEAEAGVRMIAGNGYLDGAWRVHSMDPLMDESLMGYQDFEYQYLLTPNCQYPEDAARFLLLGWEPGNYELVTRTLSEFYLS